MSTTVVADVMEILKNKGLNKSTYRQQELTELPLLVSSDIIERSPQADMNRSVLLIPALCGGQEEGVIDQALNKASQVNFSTG